MSTIIHDAIVVSSFSEDDIGEAAKHAHQLGLIVSTVMPGVVNGWRTFMIAPDGSGEGWQESIDFDVRRAKWIDWAVDAITTERLALDFVHVRFGMDANDFGGATVVTSSNEPHHPRRKAAPLPKRKRST